MPIKDATALPSRPTIGKLLNMLCLTVREGRRRRVGSSLGILALCFADCTCRVQGADSSSMCRQGFDVWQGGEGLQRGAVTSLLQSHEGYLWLGTYHGLVRFDGVRFTMFDSGNTPGLKNGLITTLYEDSDGVLWIGHETGHISRFADGHFGTVSFEGSWPGGAVEAITSDSAGQLWLLNNSGKLFRLKDGKTIEPAPGAPPNVKIELSRTQGGKPLVVSYGTVATLENGTLVPLQLGTNNDHPFFEKAVPARDGGVWALANGRLRKWFEGRWLTEVQGCPTTPGETSVLLETRSGAMLVGTLRQGLYVLSPGTAPLHFCRTNGLSHDWVRALCQDHEGNIWIGTGAGFDSLRARKVQMLSSPDNWHGCAVLSFVAHEDGSAWVGTEGAGLYYYAQQQWTVFDRTNGILNPYIWSVLETRNNQLLVGTWGGGLLVRNGDHFESPAALANLSAPALALFEGKRGEVWIGTTVGLYRYAAGQLSRIADKAKLDLPDIRCITEGADGTLWFGMSGGGLGWFRDGLLKQFRKANGVGSDFVVSLYSDVDGTLWIGTSDNGITRLRDGRFANISAAQGMPNRIVTHITDDGTGFLWLGSQGGILRASKADLNRCADGVADSVAWVNYGRAEGMTSPTCSGGFQPGACKTADGLLWFPTSRGLALVDPAAVTTNTVPPPVVIEEMLVDDNHLEQLPAAPAAPAPRELGTPSSEPQQLQDSSFSSARESPRLAKMASSIRIPPGRQRFEFHYTGLSFMAPEKVRFKYKLESLEQDWTDAGTRRTADYSYLPPGAYQFRVIACNNDGLWNNSGASLAFTVLPFFWQTWWFELASFSSGAGVLGAGVFWASRRRVKRKLEQVERQRTLERERARIARDIHDDIGASLTRITLLSQTIRSEVDRQPEVAADVDQIYGTAREVTRAMDEIVWAVNPKHDTLDSLVTYLGRYAQQFLAAASIRCRLEVPLSLPTWGLTSEIRHNTFLAFKEALNNIVKHAAATEVRISLELLPSGFVLLIIDNGRGFEPPRLQPPTKLSDTTRLVTGNGLLNMRRRMEEIGGRCEWSTAPGEGARVKLVVNMG